MSASPPSSGSGSSSMSETGFQLLARLCARPTLRNLWADTLFSGGLDPGECVEVSSDEVGGGKTEFLMNVTAKCIQPEIWGDLDIEGLGVSVIYIDANGQFDLKRLATLLDLHLAKKSQKAQQTPGRKKRPSTEQYIKSCLDNLHLMKPTDSDDLILCLEKLKDSYLMAKNDIGLLILDSLNAFYWLERPIDDLKSVKFYESPKHKKICAQLADIVETFKINVFVSLGNVFRKGGGSFSDGSEVEGAANRDDFWTNHEWRKLRTYKMRLSKRIVYQEKGSGDGAKAASSSVASTGGRSTIEKQVGQIPNQLVSFSLFNCSSKTVEKRGELLIRSAGFTQL